jgi:hypothetical protein
MATVGILNLRCTISGGLEDLATEELQQAFSSSSHRLFWIQKRNSGSQLGLQISDVVSVSTVADVIRKLRFVEYAHCVVHSQEYPMEDTPLPAPEGTNIGDATRAVPSQEKRPLSQIQAQSPSSMEPVQLHRAMSMSRNIRNTLRDRSVGLESLPGDLLPTPVVDGTAAKDEVNETKEKFGLKESFLCKHNLYQVFCLQSCGSNLCRTGTEMLSGYAKNRSFQFHMA